MTIGAHERPDILSVVFVTQIDVLVQISLKNLLYGVAKTRGALAAVSTRVVFAYGIVETLGYVESTFVNIFASASLQSFNIILVLPVHEPVHVHSCNSCYMIYV